MKIKKLILIAIALYSLLMLAFAPLPQEPTEGTVLDSIIRIVVAFSTLAGVSALIAALVAIGVSANVINADTAPKWTAGLNLIAFLVLVSFGVFRPDLSLDFLDGIAAQAATIALFVLGFITQMVVPGPVNRAFARARVPVLGVMGSE
jgi:hypothetical protein